MNANTLLTVAMPVLCFHRNSGLCMPNQNEATPLQNQVPVHLVASLPYQPYPLSFMINVLCCNMLRRTPPMQRSYTRRDELAYRTLTCPSLKTTIHTKTEISPLQKSPPTPASPLPSSPPSVASCSSCLVTAHACFQRIRSSSLQTLRNPGSRRR